MAATLPSVTPARLGFWLALALLLGPALVGGLGLALPAAGILPALGFETFSLDAWRAWWALPGLAASFRVTLISGVGATLLALGLTLAWLLGGAAGRSSRKVERLLLPLLATPHLALAVGLLLLLAPSGLLMRCVAQGLGWVAPPLAGLPDRHGVTLAVGLALKEAPFLMLMAQAGLTRLPLKQYLETGRTLGYSPPQVMWRIVWPLLAPGLKLPLMAVLAYSLSVVDVAQVLGPSLAPTLAVRLVELWRDPDPAMRLPASVGALMLAALVGGCLAIGDMLGRILQPPMRRWRLDGRRRPRRLSRLSWRGGSLMLAGALAAVLVLPWRAFAERWFFPALWPQQWGVDAWRQGLEGLQPALVNTLMLGGASASLALGLAMACLEHERERPLPRGFALWIYVPLLLPQAGFLFGVQVVMLACGVAPGWPGVLLGHLLFCLPYAWLTLAGPWRGFDSHLEQVARLLGRTRWQALVQVRLRLLAGPLAISWAVAFAVSVAQYVPTVILGGGRVATLTTETLALAGGADPRLTAVGACLQAMLPLGVFVLAYRVRRMAR
ncbi:ABC transporter permease [Halomonas shantousis]